ncbi:hypothetical protein J0895_22500, partial [Phormidium pseudopriestleyi FRX01]
WGSAFQNNKESFVSSSTRSRLNAYGVGGCKRVESSSHRAFHPTLTFDRYSVGIPVCLAKIERKPFT